jgi:hypothetical protein
MIAALPNQGAYHRFPVLAVRHSTYLEPKTYASRYGNTSDSELLASSALPLTQLPSALVLPDSYQAIAMTVMILHLAKVHQLASTSAHAAAAL